MSGSSFVTPAQPGDASLAGTPLPALRDSSALNNREAAATGAFASPAGTPDFELMAAALRGLDQENFDSPGVATCVALALARGAARALGPRC
jgi:hypothetical protein